MVNRCGILSYLSYIYYFFYCCCFRVFYERTTRKYYCDPPILTSPRQNAHLRNSSCHDSRIVAPRRKKRKKKSTATEWGGVTSGARCISVSDSFSVSLFPSIFSVSANKNGTLVTNDPRPVRVTISRREFALFARPSMRRTNSGVGVKEKEKKYGDGPSPFCRLCESTGRTKIKKYFSDSSPRRVKLRRYPEGRRKGISPFSSW